MPNETLGTQIRTAREKLGWSQATLARKLNVVCLTVIRWEQDKSVPREEYRPQLRKLLNLSEEVFLLAQEPRTKNQGAREHSQEYEPTTQQNRSHTDEGSQEGKEPQPESTDFIEFRIPPTKIYRGWSDRDDTSGLKEVTVDGRPLPYVHFDRSGYVVAEATGHFGWGYTGRGPANLALSILADYFEGTPLPGEARREVFQAWKYHYNFKMDFVAWFKKKSWEISSWAIAAWLQEQKEQGDPAPEHTLLDIEHGWRGWSNRWDKYY